MELPPFRDDVADFMKAGHFDAGGLPGFLGIAIDTVEPGSLVASLEVGDHLLNPLGVIHGGVIATLVDHVLGAALYPYLEDGAWVATTEFKLNLLRPVRGGRLAAVATIRSMTRRTAVVQIEVTNEGQDVALAQGTVTLKPPKPTTTS